jgi:hypothetical protein
MSAVPPGLPENAVRFPASDTPPPGYPETLPFAPGVRAMVTLADDGVGVKACTWLVGGEDESRLGELRHQAHALAAGYGEIPGALNPAEGGPVSAEALREAAEAMPPSLLERAGALLRSMADPGAAAAASRVADVVVEASRADGWMVEDDQSPPFPLLVRMVRLRRGGVERHLSAGCAPGSGAYVLLMEREERTSE